MTYNKLISKLPEHTELHYLSDTDPEYQSSNYTYILFEYTTDWLILFLHSNQII